MDAKRHPSHWLVGSKHSLLCVLLVGRREYLEMWHGQCVDGAVGESGHHGRRMCCIPIEKFCIATFMCIQSGALQRCLRLHHAQGASKEAGRIRY